MATFISLSTYLKSSSFSTFGLSSTSFAIFILVITTIFSLFIILNSGGNIWYGMALIWGLFGVIVANIIRVPNHPVALFAGGLMLVVVIAVLYKLFSMEKNTDF